MFVSTAYAQSALDRYDFHIKGGALGPIMDEIHDRTGVQLLFSNDLVEIDGLNSVIGSFTLKEALEILLQGTGLSCGLTESGMVVITRKISAKAQLGEINDVNKQLKKSLLMGAAAATITMGNQQAVAQQAEPVEEVKELETIIVTGIKASLEQAVDRKRNSSVITDVISATDLGRFPDENVAESLQRVTGVQITRVRGEGSQVSIRGLPPGFTATTLNGRNMASAFNLGTNGAANRSFEFSALPSEFVNTLEVYKSPMASLQEGGLSGTVIVRTPSPLDIGKRQIALSAQGAHESNSGKISPRIAGLYSDVFADGTVGVTFGAALSQRDSESHSVLSRGFRSSRQNTQNIILLENFTDEKERLSLMGKVEWEPQDNLRLFADAFYTSLDNTAVRDAAAYNFGNTIGRVNDTSLEQIVDAGTTRENVNGTLLNTRLTVENMELRAVGRVQTREGDTIALATGGKYTAGPWDFSGEVSYSSSEQVGNGLNLLARVNIEDDLPSNLFVPVAGYDTTVDNVTSLIVPAASQAVIDNLANYELLGYSGEFGSTIDDKILSAKFDAEREVDWAVPVTFKFGAAYSKQEQDGIPQRLGGVTTSEIASVVGLPQRADGKFDASSIVQFTGAGAGSFLDAYDGSAIVPSTFVTARTQEVFEQFGEQLAAAGVATVNAPQVIDVTEEILAFYGQLDFASSDDRLSGNFGVRVITTDQSSSGVSPDLTAITFEPDNGAFIGIPAAAPVSVSRSYTDILPSGNLQVELTDDLVARFAASRTMARPSLAVISPSITSSNTPPTLNFNNPYLDPFRSNNFDMSLEWYFDSASILSATIFQKDIVSLIDNESELTALPITEVLGDGTRNPINQDFTLNTKINGSGVNLQGVEFTFQHSFSNLPGLLANTGALLNYTYIDNSDPSRVVGASANNFNASGYYEGEKLSLRLSYTWRDEYLLSSTAQENFGRFIEASGILDGNITYDFNENLSAVLEGINLLDEPSSSIDGNGFPAIFEDNGRRVLFGVRAKF